MIVMETDIEKIKASAANGLTKTETEAILGRKLTNDERIDFERVKAAMKLKARREKDAIIRRENANKPGAVNPKSASLRPSVASRYTEDQVRVVVEKTHGLTNSICASLDCSY